MRVTKLPLDPGPAGWNAILPPQSPPAPLDQNITADYLIIGAGFAGLTAAHRLRTLHPTARIVVLDATRIAHGPAGRNSGFMIDLPHDLSSDHYSGALEKDRAQTADNRHAITYAAEMATQYGMSAEAFSKTGKLNAAATDRGECHNQEYARHLRAMDEPYEVLDAQAMHALTGTPYYQSGLFTPGAAMIQPAMYIRSLADGLRAQGVEIYENSPVTSLDRGTDWVAHTPSGHITAPKVILAVNGHLNSFGHMRGRLMHVFTYASMTRALTAAETTALGGQPNWSVLPSDPMGTTVRRISGTGGDRIVIRNRFTIDPSMTVTNARMHRVAQDHRRAFGARFPMLAGVEMEHVWGGRLCLSLNNVPVIGKLNTGLYAACVQNGLGTVQGSLAGILVAELMNDISSPALDRALAAPPPNRLFPQWMMALGGNGKIRFSEWRAGGEF